VTTTGDWNQKIIEEFRANEGQVGGQLQGAPLLLLHTVGARSGKERVTPVMYRRLDDDTVAVFASKAGAPTNPDWYHNLLVNPSATVEIGSQTYDVTSRVLDDDQREPIWTKHKAEYPGFAEYESKTSRTIPVVVLKRRH